MGMAKIFRFMFCATVAHSGCVLKPSTCYTDTPSRILGGTNYNAGGTLSLEFCAQLCHDHNMTMAGAEFGRNLPSTQFKYSLCDMC